MVARLALLFVLLACPDGQQSDRVPAGVISPSGAAWLERASRPEEERPEIAINAMKLSNGDVVADVGAGTGFYTRRLARAVGPDGVVYASDIQPEMIAILKEKAAEEKLTNIVPVVGTETDPKLPAGKFDWILLVDVYHEFQQPQPMLEKLEQALKPDGRVALVEYRETTTQIRREHRMSKDEVLREWLPAGFRLVEIVEEMPLQRLYIFEPGIP
ncbi:MAG TPA: class I SAM-dependent methyltransferase [Thermoanaerobaculia bacterium]|nr:class I SAM-dependent methyltransferase [Thermoanaerobaculia bacterium]